MLASFAVSFVVFIGAAPESREAPAAPGPSVDGRVFTTATGLTPAGEAVRRWVDKAALHGVDDLSLDASPSEDAVAAALARLVAELPAQPRTTPILFEAESHHYQSPDILWRGVTAAQAAPEAIAAATDAAVQGRLDAYLGARLPAHPQYAKLVAAAERYQQNCASGGWATAMAVPKSTRAAKADAVAAALQARLAAEGFYRPAEGAAPSGVWDDATRAAVDAYRDARQLESESLVDKELVDSLNVSCPDRLRQLELNVRRWRVSAWHGETTSVQVNLAAQELRYERDGALAMRQKTVVGNTRWYTDEKRKRKVLLYSTPILADHISRVILNPEWSVPARIARNELDEEIAKDPDYIATHHFRVKDGPGGKMYVQESGPWNALGQIKILFPNSESVYLHDTPKKGAFNRQVRALSHGCVRVQNALEFGLALLAADAGAAYDDAGMRHIAQWSPNYIIDLKSPVPVFFEYYTASVDDAGVVHFHPDIYGFDAESLKTTASR